MKRQLRTTLLIAMLLFAHYAGASVVQVSSASAINNGSWQAGDTLQMTGGTWTNQKITLRGNGTQTAPIVLKAATAGTTLTGTSILTLNGDWLVADGLTFSGTYSGTSHIITFADGSTHCRLTNTSILSYNLSDTDTDTKWVSINGQDHRVDHCRFDDKRNIGTLLVVWLEDGTEARHRIDHNHFGLRTPLLDSDGSELNGQEIIRVGDSGSSMTQAKCTVECNYFEHCNGEIEIISNKSCGNTYRCNTFYECHGMLTLRHGNDCLVDGNCFIGNDTAQTGGVRIIGEGHTVINNYMYALTGNNYRSGVCIVRGKQNSALNEYFQVKNALVANNTFVNCAQALCINYNSSSSCAMPPVSTTIACNLFYLENSYKNKYLVNVSDSTTGMDVTLSGNIANQGKYKNFSPQTGQLSKGVSFSMQTETDGITLMVPADGSALENYRSATPAVVTTDLLGRTRPATHLPGCSETTGTTTREPAYAGNTGPGSEIDTPTTDIDTNGREVFIGYFTMSGIRLDNPQHGCLRITEKGGQRHAELIR